MPLLRGSTLLLHGAEACESVEAAARALFGQGELQAIDIATLAGALAELPRTEIKDKNAIATWVDLIVATGVVESKSAARRIIKEGGAYINNVKVTSEDFAPTSNDLIGGRFIVLRKGKRDLAAVEVVA